MLCDIDGMLRHWPVPGHADLDRLHGLPAGTLAAAAFTPSRLHPAITGKITDEQWRSTVTADIAEACGSMDRARAVVTAWSDLMPRVDQEVVALLKRARKAVTVALVSNATTQLDSDLARQGLDVLADAVVNTAHIGVAKPDPRVYLIAAERVGAPVHRCLFIDDTAADVTAAREVGMTALHYREPEESPRRLLSAPRSPGSPERSIPNQLRGRATLGILANPHQHPVAVFARRSRRRAARRPGRFRRCGRSVA